MTEIVLYDTAYADAINEMIREFHKDSLNDYGIDMEEGVNRIGLALAESTFIMLEDGKAIGVLCGQVIKQHLSGKKMYQEVVWYVHKDHRTKGKLLLDHLEKWCAENDISSIIMVYMHNSQGERLHKFYERQGYKPMETHLIKEVQHG